VLRMGRTNIDIDDELIERTMQRYLIAAVAVRSGAALLHGARDFDVFARHTPSQVA